MESCKSCCKVVAVGINVDLKLCCFLCKHSNPRIEILNAKELKLTILQILLKHKDIGDRVRDWSTGSENNSASVILSLNTMNLVHHSLALARAIFIKSLDTNYSTIERNVFIVMRFVYKESVDAKLIKRNFTDVLGHIPLESLHQVHHRLSLSVNICFRIKACTCLIKHRKSFFVKLLVILS